MCPRTSKQIEQIRQEKKKLIMDTAMELFAEKGFHATSMSEISLKAKISKGLTYNYFQSKNDLLEEIIHNGFEQIYINFDLDKDGVLTNDEFNHFIRSVFRMIKENPHYWKLYYALMLQPAVNEKLKEEFSDHAQPLYLTLYDYLQRNGSIDPDGDLLIIHSLIEGAIWNAILEPEFMPIDIVTEKILQVIPKMITKNN